MHRLPCLQCCEQHLFVHRNGQSTDLDFPPPEFEGTATAYLRDIGLCGQIGSSLSLCMCIPSSVSDRFLGYGVSVTVIVIIIVIEH